MCVPTICKRNYRNSNYRLIYSRNLAKNRMQNESPVPVRSKRKKKFKKMDANYLLNYTYTIISFQYLKCKHEIELRYISHMFILQHVI